MSRQTRILVGLLVSVVWVQLGASSVQAEQFRLHFDTIAGLATIPHRPAESSALPRRTVARFTVVDNGQLVDETGQPQTVLWQRANEIARTGDVLTAECPLDAPGVTEITVQVLGADGVRWEQSCLINLVDS